MENIEALAKAQKLDAQIMQLKNKIENLDEGKALKKVVEIFDKADREFKDITHNKLELEKKIKRFEEEVKGVVDKISKEEKKLYSGTITNPKELGAIQKEIEALRKKQDSYETQELELMQELDGVNKKYETIAENHRKISEDKERKQESYDKARSALEEQLAETRNHVRDVKALIEPRLLFNYESLREEKAGIGAAFLINGICSGCHIALPENEVAGFVSKDVIGKCSNCKRLLIPPKYADI